MDLTNAQWARIEPLIPVKPRRAEGKGRSPTHRGRRLPLTRLPRGLLPRTGRDAQGLRLFTIGNNFIMTGFAAWAGISTGASGGELVVVVGLVLSVTVLSLLQP
jgi:hypothetical protein